MTCDALRRNLWAMTAALAMALLMPAGVQAADGDAPQTAAPAPAETQSTDAAESTPEAPPEATPEASSASSSESAATPARQPEPGSAEEVMKKLVEQIRQNPLVEPTPTPGSAPAPGSAPGSDPGQTQGKADAPPVRVSVDRNIIGIAPNGKAPELRREGEFVVSRKGRIVRANDGLHTLFVFEADSSQSPEAPMVLLPCLMLQSMEDLVAQRGEHLRFVLSGQILVYRGVNYILPTMMTLAEDRGNLQ